jgi:hypothetical protein
MCGALKVSRCDYYDWRITPESDGAHQDLMLTEVIRSGSPGGANGNFESVLVTRVEGRTD